MQSSGRDTPRDLIYAPPPAVDAAFLAKAVLVAGATLLGASALVAATNAREMRMFNCIAAMGACNLYQMRHRVRANCTRTNDYIERPSTIVQHSQEGSTHRCVRPAAPKGPSPPRRRGGRTNSNRKSKTPSKLAVGGGREGLDRSSGGGGGGGNWRAYMSRRELSTWPCASSAAARRTARAAAGAGARRTGRPGRRPAG